MVDEKHPRFTLAFLVALGLMSLTLASCNTVEGAGKDLEEAGEAIQDAAD